MDAKLLGLWFFLAFVVGAYARRKGLRAGKFTFLSMAFTPILGLIVVLLARPDEAMLVARGLRRKCPHCAELIRADANVCRFCGRDLPPKHADAPTEPKPRPKIDLLNGVSWGMVGLLLFGLGLIIYSHSENERLLALEDSVRSDLLQLAAAITVYEDSCGSLPETMSQLGPPPPGEKPGCKGVDLFDPTLFSTPGYQMSYTPKRAASGRIIGFAARATPTGEDRAGRKAFYVDESGTFRWEYGLAGPQSLPLDFPVRRDRD